MPRSLSILVWLASALFVAVLSRPASAQTVRTVEVSSKRITLGDLLPAVGGALADIDVGHAPAPGGSRIIHRREIERELERQKVQGVGAIPATVRVLRKVNFLDREKLRALTKKALLGAGLPRGVMLRSLRPPARARVPAGYDAVAVKLPKPPRRQGNWATTALVSFEQEGKVLARVVVPVDLVLDETAAQPDVAKGTPLTLLVRRGLIEIRVKVVAGANADVGDIFPVQMRPSGRVLRAKLTSRQIAEVVGR